MIQAPKSATLVTMGHLFRSVLVAVMVLYHYVHYTDTIQDSFVTSVTINGAMTWVWQRANNDGTITSFSVDSDCLPVAAEVDRASDGAFLGVRES